MKKFFSLLAIMCLIVVSNCSEIPENNDPVLGKWSKISTETLLNKGPVNVEEEWIFNDVFLGRYHRYENNELTLINDFSWDNTKGTYTILYTGMDTEPVSVIFDHLDTVEILTLMDGNIFAQRD